MTQHGSDSHQQWVLSDWFCSHTHDGSNVGVPQLHPLGNFIHGLQGDKEDNGLMLCLLHLTAFHAAPNRVSSHMKMLSAVSLFDGALKG